MPHFPWQLPRRAAHCHAREFDSRVGRGETYLCGNTPLSISPPPKASATPPLFSLTVLAHPLPTRPHLFSWFHAFSSLASQTPRALKERAENNFLLELYSWYICVSTNVHKTGAPKRDVRQNGDASAQSGTCVTILCAAFFARSQLQKCFPVPLPGPFSWPWTYPSVPLTDLWAIGSRPHTHLTLPKKKIFETVTSPEPAPRGIHITNALNIRGPTAVTRAV